MAQKISKNLPGKLSDMTAKKITGKSKLAQKAEKKTDPKEQLDLVAPRKKPTLKGTASMMMTSHA